MSTNTLTRTSSEIATSEASRPLLGFGLGSAAVFIAGLVVYGIGPVGDDAAAVAAAIEQNAGRLRSGVLLIMLGLLLATYVVAALSRATRPTSAGRLVLPLGVGYLLLLAAAFGPMAGAITVEQDIFGGAVSPGSAATALVVMNALMPLAGFAGAGFLLATGISGELPKALRITGYVFAVALLVPPVAWAVQYLLPLWLAAAAVSLSRR